jgi:hypothetical protein
LAGDTALAQGRGKTKAKEPAAAKAVVQVEFGPRDRDLITTYYRERAAGLPPGLAKRDGALPPGLEKQLERNGTLPPGLRKKITPVPPALSRQLTPIPAGYRRGIVDGHLIVYRLDSYVITDIIVNIVR